MDMAADRGAFIDQSQSFNVHMSDPNFGKITSLHFYAWKVSLPHTAALAEHFDIKAVPLPERRFSLLSAVLWSDRTCLIITVHDSLLYDSGWSTYAAILEFRYPISDKCCVVHDSSAFVLHS